MRNRLVRCALAATLVCALAPQAAAVTWFPQDFHCPVCKTKNTFLVVGSYGSYVYQDASRFQLVFWPYTDGPTVYSCKNCRLSVFMWDFEKVPKEKHAEIVRRLEGVRLEARKKGAAGSYEDAVYLGLPVSERLRAARIVYEVLGRDDHFWCHFERVAGYHYEAEKKEAEAAGARRRALDLALKLMGQEARAGERKELLYISGAMRHFLKDDKGALRDFNEAMALRYRNKAVEEEKQKNYDEFLGDLLRQYVGLLGAAPDKGKRAG